MLFCNKAKICNPEYRRYVWDILTESGDYSSIFTNFFDYLFVVALSSLAFTFFICGSA